ncbi:hypothetical protein PsYK624_171360 [Phanerochaete sordida]|uniref:Uncharacterized protein n=1 Tax=Phanerochaete sordida TaxID=48140 RepID=A0A9P3GS58_9APHY|nr:hypothetical protein PsYK624_171360 [Phanerochaete sordida]
MRSRPRAALPRQALHVYSRRDVHVREERVGGWLAGHLQPHKLTRGLNGSPQRERIDALAFYPTLSHDDRADATRQHAQTCTSARGDLAGGLWASQSRIDPLA